MSEDVEKDEPATSREPAKVSDAAENWFLHKRLDLPAPDGDETFEDWKEADPRHAAAYEDVEGVWQFVPDLQQAFDDRPADAENATVPLLRPAGPATGDPAPEAPARGPAAAAHSPDRSPARWRWRAAACIALVAAPLAWFASGPRADHRTAVGQVQEIILPDGGVAWLNTDTAIKISFGETSRTVTLLQGEAEFNVAADPKRPFSVLANGGAATALGTVFTVRTTRDAATVTVAEGTVRVVSRRPKDGTADTSPAGLRLRAGQRVSYADRSAPGPVSSVAVASNDWRDGFIALKNVSFGTALAEIDRYLPGRIFLVASSPASKQVYSRLAISNLRSGLKALAATHKFKIVRLTDYVTVIY